MTLNRSFSLSLLLLLAGLPSLAQSSLAKASNEKPAPKAAGQSGQSQPAEFSNDGVEKVVHEAKIFSSEFPLHAIIKAPEAEI